MIHDWIFDQWASGLVEMIGDQNFDLKFKSRPAFRFNCSPRFTPSAKTFLRHYPFISLPLVTRETVPWRAPTTDLRWLNFWS